MAEALAEEDVWSRVYPEEGLLDCPGAALASGTKSQERGMWRITLLEPTHLPQRSQTAMRTTRREIKMSLPT